MASAVLVATGVLLLLLSFFSFGPPLNPRTVMLLLVAAVAAYVFIRVGRDIWRDLRAQLPGEKDTSDEIPEDDAKPPSSD